MKWMGGWSRFDLESARPEHVAKIIELMEEEAREAERLKGQRNL